MIGLSGYMGLFSRRDCKVKLLALGVYAYQGFTDVIDFRVWCGFLVDSITVVLGSSTLWVSRRLCEVRKTGARSCNRILLCLLRIYIVKACKLGFWGLGLLLFLGVLEPMD